MKKHIAEKYFVQKNWTVLETICVIVALLFAIVGTFIDGGGPIGLPLAAVALVALIISKTTKISDADIDNLLKSMIEAEVDVKGSKQVISTFDLRSGKIKKGRDGKVRSSSYVMSCFSVVPHATEINVYTIDLISEKTERSRYSISKDASIVLKEDKIKVGDAQKKIQYIESSSPELSLPVNTDDVNECKIIEMICTKKTAE